MKPFVASTPLRLYRASVDWNTAKSFDDQALIQFIKSNHIHLSTSISLEHLYGFGLTDIQVITVLEYCTKRLNIRHIRLGLRWNQISVSKTNQLDMTYYHAFLNWFEIYAGSLGLSFTLNLGPVKVFRWPEQHIPEWIMNKISVPQTLTPESQLAKFGASHLKQLSRLLRKKYPNLVASTTHIQLENELFNPFGTNKTVSTTEYITLLCTQLPGEWLTTKRLLWNGSGHYDTPKILVLITSLSKKFPTLKHTIGLDYYYTSDAQYNLKWTRIFDHVSIRPTGLSSTNLSSELAAFKSQNIDVDTQISESQWELWGRAVHPGANLAELSWLIVRCNHYRPKDSNPFWISLWGVEAFLCRVLGYTPYATPFSIVEDQKVIAVLNQSNDVKPVQHTSKK